MRGKCPRCGEQDLVQQPTKLFRLGLPWLNSLAKTEIPKVCVNCGSEVKTQIQNFDNFLPKAPLQAPGKSDIVKLPLLSWYGRTFLTMQGVLRLQDRVFVPNSEGRIQDPRSVVDQFGDPDLMAEMAREYLRQFWILLPKGRLPNSLKELMPALLLLVTSAELALKSFAIREEKPARGHSLKDLYDNICMAHKIETERLFRKDEIVAATLANDKMPPQSIISCQSTPIHTDNPSECMLTSGTLQSQRQCFQSQAMFTVQTW